MKLLANENFPKASVLLLRSLGYDVTSIGEDSPSISDRSVMQIAEAEQRIIQTFDRDYGELIYKHNYKWNREYFILDLIVIAVKNLPNMFTNYLQSSAFKLPEALLCTMGRT
ncbi:DUF5615 family PIN-like protein [Segetibacter koreensis]|uniref:DUF5615 family PIN-like protein n=1 Tax=Segetibacter koreensis TaxID=398037 RepID=UPI000685F8F4|nr:DUF5615 family PIN-like protein [Segetibacter koreensis]